ncbi:MAG: FkbM family methyltransferase [Patescibacteria group bacterium]|nr:FkbM family methyltransferase [Patescibacteria group bacterium]
MKYNYVDIGTSDFNTSFDYLKDDELAILVEPIIYYLNKFPDKPNVFKCPFAIGEYDGITKIYYVKEEIIKRKNYPLWAKGCNKIGEPHPTLIQNGIPLSDFSVANVPVISVKTFVNMYNISEINKLKIDTEGYDSIILNLFYNLQLFEMIKINEIKFEYIWNKSELNDIVEKYNKYWNTFIQKDGDDIIIKLGERK